MSITIAMVPPSMVQFVWPKCLPYLNEVKKKAPDDICLDVTLNNAVNGHTLLVTVLDGDEVIAVNIMDVQTLETGVKVLYIPITGGTRMEEWMDEFLKMAHGIAKAHGCKELRGLAVRKGWLRKLSSYGWKEHFVTIKCKVEE